MVRLFPTDFAPRSPTFRHFSENDHRGLQLVGDISSCKGRKFAHSVLVCYLLLANLPDLANTATSHIVKYPFPTILTDTWRPGIGGLHSAVQTSPAASCLTWSPHIGFCLWSVRIPTRTSKLDRGLDRGPGTKRCTLNYPCSESPRDNIDGTIFLYFSVHFKAEKTKILHRSELCFCSHIPRIRCILAAAQSSRLWGTLTGQTILFLIGISRLFGAIIIM